MSRDEEETNEEDELLQAESNLISITLRCRMEQSDHDSESNRNHSARQSDFSVPVEAKMDSSNESETNQSHSVPREEEDLPSHSQTPPSGSVKQPSAITPPQKVPVHRNQEPLTPRGETGGESRDDGTPSKQRHCKCKASRCLKLYCECFASGSYCNGCNCLKCHNTSEKERERQEAIKAILERNPYAFKAKIAGSPRGTNDLKEDVSQLVTLGKHSRGCHCKRSGCLKKYCECYQAKVRCSDNCRCRDCKNFEGSEEIQQTTNASVELAAIGMSDSLNLPRSRKIKAASHSVAARGSSALPHIVENQTVDYVVRDGDTSLFTVPNNRAVPGTTAPTYRSSRSDTINVKELCSLLVSKSVDVENKMSSTDKKRKDEKDSSLDPAQRDDANEINDSPDCVLDAGTIDEKPMSPLMSDEEPVTISEKETSERVRTSHEKEDNDRSSEVYAEQEMQILLCFRDHLYQLLNSGSINGTSIQKANTDPSRKGPEDEEQSHRDPSLGA